MMSSPEITMFRPATKCTRFVMIRNGCLRRASDDVERRRVFSELLEQYHVSKSIVHSVPQKSEAMVLEYGDEVVAERTYQQLHGDNKLLYGGLPILAGYSMPVYKQPSPGASLPNVSSTNNKHGYPPGLHMIEEFLTRDQEQTLIHHIDSLPWMDQVISRRVQHYGYAFDYVRRQVDLRGGAVAQLPAFLAQPVLERLPVHLGACVPDQCTVNEYTCGQGIGMHVDTHSAFHDGFASLSLLSDTVMTFRRLDENMDGGDDGGGDEDDEKDGREVVHVYVPRRSLMVFTGEARYIYEHGISKRKSDKIDGRVRRRTRRVSLTLRRVLSSGVCRCEYSAVCDSQQGTLKPTFKQQQQDKEEDTDMRQQVHEFYDRVSRHFDHTRHSPWPRVRAWIESLPANSSLADIGCGNGRHMLCAREAGVNVVGVDVSEELVRICRAKGFDKVTMVGDALDLPLEDAAFDNSMSIAVVHHLSTHQQRLRAIQELIRITKPGGNVLVYAWAMEQEPSSKHSFEQQDCMVKWHLPARYDPTRNNGVDDDDDDDDGGGDVVVERYCHVYVKGELESLCREAVSTMKGRTMHTIESYYDRSNWCVLFSTTST